MWHPGNVSENRVAAFDNVLHDWRYANLVCCFNVSDMILPPDAEYLTLAFHMEALKDPGIFSA